MFHEIFKYDKKKDLAPVAVGLAVDLNEAIATGTIPGTGVEVEYNGIDSTSMVLGRVHDVFDAVEHQRSLASKYSAAVKNDSAKVSAPAVASSDGKTPE